MDIYSLTRPFLFALDAERAHELTLRGVALADKLGIPSPAASTQADSLQVMGLQFPNRVGLAAGLDKNAIAVDGFSRLGFGFIEVGTVTPRAQPGNPAPRLFRLPDEQAIINRMGFNNEGLEAFAGRLARRQGGVVGANIGANKDSEDRVGDYVTGLRRLWGLASYFTINISSPNTPGLRALQTRDALQELLGRLGEARDALPPAGKVPMFLKVAPDLDDAEVEAISDVVAEAGLDAVIVSNTTISRPPLKSAQAGETGGLSGAPLMDLSTQTLRLFHQAAEGRFPLAGAGGVSSGADAYAKIRAGACVVQLYSALVFSGPGLVGRIKTDLAARLRADGFSSTAEAVATA